MLGDAPSLYGIDKPFFDSVVGAQNPVHKAARLWQRHETMAQHANVAAKLANMCSGERTDLASNEALISQTDAAKLMNVGRTAVQSRP